MSAAGKMDIFTDGTVSGNIRIAPPRTGTKSRHRKGVAVDKRSHKAALKLVPPAPAVPELSALDTPPQSEPQQEAQPRQAAPRSKRLDKRSDHRRRIQLLHQGRTALQLQSPSAQKGFILWLKAQNRPVMYFMIKEIDEHIKYVREKRQYSLEHAIAYLEAVLQRATAALELYRASVQEREEQRMGELEQLRQQIITDYGALFGTLYGDPATVVGQAVQVSLERYSLSQIRTNLDTAKYVLDRKSQPFVQPSQNNGKSRRGKTAGQIARAQAEEAKRKKLPVRSKGASHK